MSVNRLYCGRIYTRGRQEADFALLANKRSEVWLRAFCCSRCPCVLLLFCWQTSTSARFPPWLRYAWRTPSAATCPDTMSASANRASRGTPRSPATVSPPFLLPPPPPIREFPLVWSIYSSPLYVKLSRQETKCVTNQSSRMITCHKYCAAIAVATPI